MTQTLRTIADIRQQTAKWRANGERVALVPTMGALHEGHLSLLRMAKNQADRVVLSIFVNPTQFGEGEDYGHYPRQEAEDVALCAAEGADAVFCPTVEEMYPKGFASTIRVSGVSEGLCGAHRPRHFDGVATIVTKLLQQVQPHMAIFGEKDYQQLQVIKRVVQDLNQPVEVYGAPTMREASGLALSSRNRYLSDQEKEIAPLLYKELCALRDRITKGEAIAHHINTAKERLIAAGFARVEYLELRDVQSFQAVTAFHAPARLLVAAHLGTTRLIDNIAVE